jgi:hypothetical protein
LQDMTYSMSALVGDGGGGIVFQTTWDNTTVACKKMRSGSKHQLKCLRREVALMR